MAGVAILTLAFGAIGLSSGVASASVRRPVPADNGWYKCASQWGWGFLAVGGTIFTPPGPWTIAGVLGSGKEAYEVNVACGYTAGGAHIGYRALCGSHFIGFADNGKAIYDYRQAYNGCEVPPEVLDNVWCNYLHGSDATTCLNQLLYNYGELYAQGWAPWYPAVGGGGGASW